MTTLGGPGPLLDAAREPPSGQPWCRDRLACPPHDIMIGVTQRRAEILARDAG